MFSLLLTLTLLLTTVFSIPLDARKEKVPGFNNAPSTSTSTAMRIMPLGDSITFGFSKGDSKTFGSNGYRQQLLTQLNNANYDAVTFVGTVQSGTMADKFNEGHPGFRIKEIQDAAAKAFNLAPNVILLHAGTNDILQPDGTDGEAWKDMSKRLGTLIDTISNLLPDTLIITAKILQNPARSYSQQLTQGYNTQVQNLVAAKQKAGVKITLADFSGINTKYLTDKVHPDEAGYVLMGNIWAEAVKSADKKGLISNPADAAEPMGKKKKVTKRV